MSDHYFTENPSSAHRPFAFERREGGRVLAFETDAGVFSRTRLDKGTEILLEALPPCQGRALDLGCGWGGLGLCLLARNPGLTLVLSDVNARAADLARANLARNGLQAQVTVSDGFQALEGLFDLIAFNPPVRAGKAVIYRLFEEAGAHLAPHGALYIVLRKQQGAPSAKAFLAQHFAAVETVDRSAGYWVLRCAN